MKNQPTLSSLFLKSAAILFCLALLSLTGCADNSAQSDKKFFDSPDALANAVFSALQEEGSQSLKSLVPTKQELQDWFDREKVSDPEALSKQEELLRKSDELLNEDAQEMYDEMQAEGIQETEIKEISHEVSDKFFYQEADITILLDNNCRIKLTDCIKTDKGWVFIRKGNFTKSE